MPRMIIPIYDEILMIIIYHEILATMCVVFFCRGRIVVILVGSPTQPGAVAQKRRAILLVLEGLLSAARIATGRCVSRSLLVAEGQGGDEARGRRSGFTTFLGVSGFLHGLEILRRE